MWSIRANKSNQPNTSWRYAVCFCVINIITTRRLDQTVYQKSKKNEAKNIITLIITVDVVKVQAYLCWCLLMMQYIYTKTNWPGFKRLQTCICENLQIMFHMIEYIDKLVFTFWFVIMYCFLSCPAIGPIVPSPWLLLSINYNYQFFSIFYSFVFHSILFSMTIKFT